MDNKKYCQDSPFNRHILKITEQYSALLKLRLEKQLEDMKKGAHQIAAGSKNPKLKEICEKLDQLKFE